MSFNFGSKPSVSFNLGGNTTTNSGFTLGTSSGINPASTSSGFTLGGGLGSTPAASTSSGFTLGGGGLGGAPASSASAPSTVGFNFGGGLGTAASTATTTPASGFSFGTGLGGTTSAAAASTGGFTLGAGGLGGTSTTSTGGLTLGTSTAGGLQLGKPGGLTLGSTTTSLGLGGGLGNLAKSTASGLTLGTAGTSTGFSLGGTTTSTTGFGLGGGLGGTSAASSAATNVFSNLTTKPQTVGLGGVDPKTSVATSGGVSVAESKPGDPKTLKKSLLPQEMVLTVDSFQKYVKEEKTVQDNLARMSSKPMYKVEEEVMTLKQSLSVVANGVQRYSCAVEKLKREMTQELKNAEMTQRTRDIPAGLQYENTAPVLYFQKLVEDFEQQMLTYRQQIETLEGHLASLNQPSRLTPDELIGLMKKLHEAFIALAAQLHQIHENVKILKEHYLNYRRIFLQDNKNIFEKERPQSIQPQKPALSSLGPSPFTGMTNAASMAIASALSRSQQPSAGPPVAGLTGGNQTFSTGGGSLFGNLTTKPVGTGGGFFGSGLGATTTASTGLSFGNTQGSGFKGFGNTTANTSLFGNTSSVNLGTTQQNTQGFGLGAASPATPFLLNKPPAGNKRNKR